MKKMKVSAVIPTCNRAISLERTLDSLKKQSLKPEEVIVVDSSDDPTPGLNLVAKFPELNIKFLTSEKSVCIQRNRGIKESSFEWILLLDDDVELDIEYLALLAGEVHENENQGAFAGLFLQKQREDWNWQYAPQSSLQLFRAFVLQESVWGSLSHFRSSGSMFVRRILKFYEKRGNTFSKAGWPLITQSDSDPFRASVVSLGACLVKKQWLQVSSFDEVLEPHGIGENYGVCLGFPEPGGILVSKKAKAFHHHSMENRLAAKRTYYLRMLALQYFLSRKEAGVSTRFWFQLSILMKSVIYFLKLDFKLAIVTIKVFLHGVFRNNPYEIASKKGLKKIVPEL